MTRIALAQHLATAHLVLCGVALIWNLWIAGRAARVQGLPRTVAFLSALGGLLVVPALVVLLVTNSLLAGRTLFSLVWIWPATVLFFTAQAAFALARRRTVALIGVPILLLDLLLLGIAVARWMDLIGAAPGTPLLALLAADRGAIAAVAQPLALRMPWFLFVPLFAPVAPRRHGAGRAGRGGVALLAAAWTVAIAAHIPSGARAVRSYGRYAHERLQERPDSDFVIGLQVFPSLAAPPVPPAVASDLALADSVGAGALSIYVTPKGAGRATLDSLSHLLDDRRANSVLIVGLDLSREPRLPTDPSAYWRARVADVARIARLLHPDLLVPVVDPTGAAGRALGPVPVDAWTAYLRAATAAAHAADTAVRVMVHVGGIGRADSALYAWAAAPASPADAVGISLAPSLGGAAGLDARLRTVDGWMRAAQPARPVWVLEAEGFPLAHGEESQARALWGTLAWATSRAAIRGVVVRQAADYGVPIGLRTAGGRLRPAVAAVRRAANELHGTAN